MFFQKVLRLIENIHDIRGVVCKLEKRNMGTVTKPICTNLGGTFDFDCEPGTDFL